MCQKKLRKRKISFNSLNFGSQLIISLLVVLFLGLFPLAALPWRAVSKLELKDQVESKSSIMESSQQNSLQNSSEVKSRVYDPMQAKRQVLQNVDELLVNTSISQIQSDADLNQQIFLTQLLYDDKVKMDKAYAEKAVQYDEAAVRNQQLEKELYGPKFITEVSGLYNLETGFGVGAAMGLKVGHGGTIKGGASVPLETLMNPGEIADLNNYTFQATLGWEW